MKTKPKEKKGGDMLKKLALIVVVLVALLVVFGVFLGLYSKVTIEAASAGPYIIACLDHIGPYKGITTKIKAVKKILDDNNITSISACGLYYDDPRTTSSDKLRSKGGYIVDKEVKNDIIENFNIPNREVIIAKIKAHPAIAPVKVYPKVDSWLKANSYSFAGPSLEIYHKNGVIEVQVPIMPVAAAESAKTE